jgi:GNAT superfamily N-acetyltransferase
VAAALETERRFVLALGGFTLGIAGATLVTHEKLPSPRFNFVEVGAVAPGRMTALVERSLEHYFQRALRPTFRVRAPVLTPLDAALRSQGFRPRAPPLTLLLDTAEGTGVAVPDRSVRVARPNELEGVAAFWTHERERPELLSAVALAWNHPNPDEELAPVLALEGGTVVAAALVFRHGSMSGIYAVATQPGARGRGAASDVVAFARREARSAASRRTSIFSDSLRLTARLERLGFRPALEFVEYELPRDAALEMPRSGESTPPLWRPPRSRAG